MKVVDNFLPPAYEDAIEGVLLSADFPWYLNARTSVVNYYEDGKTADAPQFTHGFYDNNQIWSAHFNLVSILEQRLAAAKNMNTMDPLRIKANLNTPFNNYPEGYHYPIHTDFPNMEGYITCIYYVNDSDGDTLFFKPDGKTEIARVTPKKGRFVYFDGSIPHSGHPPKIHSYRCLINLNFKGEM
jgi:hypothetical protein